MNSHFKAWLWRHRTSTRLAFVFQLAARLLNTAMSLLWTRLLLGAMGQAIYGQFLSFQAVTTLGGLGDLGLGGAVGIRVGRYLGEGNETGLQRFLSAARVLFLGLAGAAFMIFLVLAPWLPAWLGFLEVPGSGSLTTLFALCAPGVGLLVLSSYVNNLNHAACNFTWPVVPTLVLGQAAVLAQWLCARAHAPLWILYLPQVVSLAMTLVLGWWFLRLGHSSLAVFRPLQVDWMLWRGMLANSVWVYLYALGNVIYLATDRLLINALNPELVPLYQLNYKACELLMFMIISTSYAAGPRLTQWLASPESGQRERARRESERLMRFQAGAGIAGALAYLAGNDLFMTVWLGETMKAPVAWQCAFAANLALTAASFVGLDLAARISDRGLRLGGIAVGLTAGLNLILSFIAMKAGSILGIALATVAAQLLQGLIVSRFSCVQLGLSWVQWALRTTFLPLGTVTLGALARWQLPPTSPERIGTLLLLDAILLLLALRGLGLNGAMLREELEKLRHLRGK